MLAALRGGAIDAGPATGVDDFVIVDDDFLQITADLGGMEWGNLVCDVDLGFGSAAIEDEAVEGEEEESGDGEAGGGGGDDGSY